MKLRNFFHQPHRQELNEELLFHFESLVEQNVKRGMTPEAARKAARAAFGDMEKAAEETSGQYPGWWLDVLAQDVRYALRGLRRNLVFAVAAVVTLALGIGATTAVFSVVDRILFRSLPYAHDDRLVSVGITAPIMPQEFLLAGIYYQWKNSQTAFEALTSWSGTRACDLSETNPAHLACAMVESDFVPTLGISLLRGRNFQPDEDVPNTPLVALISYSFWKARFGAADDVVGKTVSLDGTEARIVGVLPPTFELPTLEHVDVVLPQRLSQAAFRPGATHVMYGVGLLKPGLTATQAMLVLQPQFQQALAQTPPRFRNEVRLRVRSLRDYQVHDARLTAWVLLGAVFAVLLIAGANVSGLLLARAAERETEFAVRKALGASHGRLLSQMLTEALILASLGIIAGWVLGEGLLRVFIDLSPRSIPYMDQARLDGRVLAFAVAIALLSAFLFGSSPLWARDLWRERIFRNSSGTSRPRLRQVLLVAQLSVTVMLLAAAGLLLRSARNLQNQAFGIHTDQLVTATVHFSARAYPNGTRRMQFVDRLEERLKQIPGVNAVAVSDSVPPGGLEHDRIIGWIAVEGKPKPEGGTGGNTVWRWVTPNYFSIFGIPITRGRDFTEEERGSNDHVLILSEAMAERLFSGEDPIGQHVDLHEADANNPWYTVVGVAANAKNGGLITESEPEYYKLWRNRPEDWNSFFVGANGGEIATFTLSTPANPKALPSLVRSEVAGIDNSMPIDFETIRQRISTMAERPRFEAALLSLFAALALVLAAVGLYGVIAFIVSRRTQEIAVRVALGAGKQQIAGLIGGDGIRMIGTGILFGSLGAIAVTRTFRSLLFGVSANDLLTLVCSVVVLLAISALAMWIPVRRALRVDPMQALRYE